MGLITGAPQEFDSAVQFYLQTIKSYPSLAEAYADLAELLFNKDWGKYEVDAATLWQEALRLKPDWRTLYPEWTFGLRTVGGMLIGRHDNLQEGKLVLKELIAAEREIAAQHPVGRAGIRIFSSYNVPQHIGHSCLEPDLYLKMARLGWVPSFHPLLLVPGHVANPRLLDYWSEHIEVIRHPSQVRDLLPLQKWLRYDTYYVELPNGNAYPSIEAMPLVQIEWERRGLKPLLSLKSEDYERGWDVLKRWGIPPGSWFVGMHAREAGFHNDAPSGGPTGGYRNVDIASYIPAIQSITEAGGWVIRMGDPTMRPLPPLANTIDYPHTPDRSDWMDIFLSAQCRFFVGSQSGLMNLPSIFGTPCAITNWAKLSTLPCFPSDVFIMKHVWSSELNRHLTWDEFVLPPYSTGADDRLKQMGIIMHDNSPEEIRDLVLEMLERTALTASYSAEDAQLQQRAQRIFHSEYSTKSACRVGRAYLRTHSRRIFS